MSNGMNNEVNCKVILDLLPLYEDGVVSEETAEMVRRHLATCSECREVLRRMRTPISVPPDEDTELLKKFNQRREQLQRKKKIKIICTASALAFLILFCLCYTIIPRGWEGVSRGIEPDWIMGSYHVIIYRDETPSIDLWQIDDEHERDTDTINALMDALRAGAYRAELRNVMNFTPFAPLFQNTLVQGLRGTVNLYLVKDNAVAATVSIFDTHDHIVHISVDGNPNTFFYHADGGLYDALAALMQDYGSLQSN